LQNGIVNSLSGLGEAINSLWEYIKDAILKAFKGVTDLGKNLIEGLWNGIKNAKDWLIGKIKSFCSDALGAIKAFFGIESPSRVMANEVGNFMAEGIGVGFGKTMPSVIQAMQDKLAGVTDAFQTTLNFGDIPEVQGNRIVSENSYVTKNYTNTIETVRQPQTVELVLDGTKLARTLIQPLDNEYNRLGVKI
jgi:phage-related protein